MVRRIQPRRQNQPPVTFDFPAPREGWIENTNLAQPNATRPDGTALAGAARLDNMYPTARGVVLMRGSQTYATLGAGGSPARSLFAYVVGGQEEMFASTDDAIYNITSVLEPTNVLLGAGGDDVLGTEDDDILGWSSTDGLDVVTGQTGGNWISVQFATAGGVFLRLVNGEDTPLVYDGTDFDEAPALTFEDGYNDDDASILSYVWAYKSRLFFIEKESLDAWYLAPGAIGGELTRFPMGAVFQRGGSLLWGATWSLDAGAEGGLSEQCIFVTTEGEVAVYQGSDPSDADTWAKVGVYRIGRPLGPRAWARDGGDIIICTSIGAVRLTEAIRREMAALGPTAVSYPIEDAWNEAVRSRQGEWHFEIWPEEQMAVVAFPSPTVTSECMFIANVRTGAWCRRLRWSGTCLLVFKGRMFYGTVDGRVVEANVSGLDDGQPYTGTCVPLFHDMGDATALKLTELAMPFGLCAYPVQSRITMMVDYVLTDPAVPPATAVPVGSQWDVGIWGLSKWGDSAEVAPQTTRQVAPGYGYALSPGFQITSGNIVPLDYELVRVTIMFKRGGAIT